MGEQRVHKGNAVKVCSPIAPVGMDTAADIFFSSTPTHATVPSGLSVAAARLAANSESPLSPSPALTRTLALAAEAGEVDAVKALLKLPGLDMNAAGPSTALGAASPLVVASALGHEAVVAQLLAHPGINASRADANGNCPLLHAMNEGHEAVVRQLLAHPKIDVKVTNMDGEEPLFLAAKQGHEAVVRQLLAAGCDVNKKMPDGATALIAASYFGHTGNALALLEAGADPNARLDDGTLSLVLARRADNTELVAALVAAGANVAAIFPPLVAACMLGDARDARQLLLEAKGSVTGALEADLRSKCGLPPKVSEADVEVVRKQMMSFMEDNDVSFNGARERRTKESPLGIAQAWNINHLDPNRRALNLKTIDGIAKILLLYPDMSCKVHGTTTQARKVEPLLAQYFDLDPERDVQEIMDQLGWRRAEACAQQLVAVGIEPYRLSVTSQGLAGEMKVDFIPSADPSLPPLVIACLGGDAVAVAKLDRAQACTTRADDGLPPAFCFAVELGDAAVVAALLDGVPNLNESQAAVLRAQAASIADAHDADAADYVPGTRYHALLLALVGEGLIDVAKCAPVKELVKSYIGSVAAAAHMRTPHAFDALKAAMQARLEVIAAPLERLYVEERLGERLAALGEDTLGLTVALDDAGLLPMPKFIHGYPPSQAAYEKYLLRWIVMASCALNRAPRLLLAHISPPLCVASSHPNACTRRDL